MSELTNRWPVHGLSEEAREACERHSDELLKPLGSLGQLEVIAKRLAAITGDPNPEVKKQILIIMAADNGVTEEGVASAPKSFTALQTLHILKGVTGAAVLARHQGCEVRVVDIGIDGGISHPQLIHAKIRCGTGNIVKEAAMSREEMVRAIEVGIEQVKLVKKAGSAVIGIGEMGIGNTTTTTAIVHSLMPEVPLDRLIGRGAGLTEEAFQRKKQVIEQAVAMHQVQGADPEAVLQKVGGLDIAGMVGCYLGAAHYGMPVVIDGVISMAAAYLAWKIQPEVIDYMFASHISEEPCYRYMQEAMGLHPVLDMNMRLGEGSGCPLMFHLMEAACRIQNDMATFADMDTSGDFLVDNR